MNAIETLVEALRYLPGVGPKSAQRMAYHLLKPNHRSHGLRLAQTLQHVLQAIQMCKNCRNYSEQPVCSLCQDQRRDPHLLCVVENPIDIELVEKTASFRGLYFVLHGHLSPLDGVGPQDLGLELFMQRIAQQSIHEVILATNPTMEGEATAFYIAEQIKPLKIRSTRIAYGVPLGGELEFVDSRTLGKALSGRAALLVEPAPG